MTFPWKSAPGSCALLALGATGPLAARWVAAVFTLDDETVQASARADPVGFAQERDVPGP
jgi:hypothetical protein